MLLFSLSHLIEKNRGEEEEKEEEEVENDL